MILDTHIWLWYHEGSPKLRADVKAAIDLDPEACYLSPVSLWEAHILAERGRINLGSSPEQELRRMLLRYPHRIADLTAEIAILSRALQFSHEDPADRFIAATAKAYGLPLATDDVNLKSLKWLKTV